jgi:hypothetical protein
MVPQPVMPKKSYPLEPLAKLRARNVEDATQSLAEAVAARARAETERQSAETREHTHAESSRAVRESERDALARGELNRTRWSEALRKKAEADEEENAAEAWRPGKPEGRT